MVSNYALGKNPEKTPGLNRDELSAVKRGPSMMLLNWLSDKKTIAEMMKDKYLFPNIMGDALAARVPPVVLTTTEFDFVRNHAREARDLYKRNGTFLHYIEYGGGYHVSHNNFEMAQSDVWFEDFAKLTEYYL